jgi:hypothetical protein
MALFAARSPVEERERLWIEKMLGWCEERFGRGPLAAEVLVPTPEFFPGQYSGSPEDVYNLVDLVRAYLRIDPDEIVVALFDRRPPPTFPPGSGTPAGVAGHYHVRDGRGVISIGFEAVNDPRRVVAVAAHELCHHKLLYRGVADPREADREPLTDLATVFFGLGVFTSNAAFEFSQGRGGWQSRQLGYLNQAMFGYALAYVARMRGEEDPAWAKHLGGNPHGYFKQAARYLRRQV